jgi:hypothetical protein
VLDMGGVLPVAGDPWVGGRHDRAAKNALRPGTNRRVEAVFESARLALGRRFAASARPTSAAGYSAGLDPEKRLYSAESPPRKLIVVS